MQPDSKERLGDQRASDLRRLAAQIQGIVQRAGKGSLVGLSTGWPAFDRVLAKRSGARASGLARGALHEWLGVGDGASWSPPLALVAHLAGRALEGESKGESVLWVGRSVWPYPRVLVRDFGLRVAAAAAGEGVLAQGRVELVRLSGAERSAHPFRLLERSYFVDAGDRAQRLWAIATALRCPAIGLIVADGSQFNMAATRRLQLAAEASAGLVLLLRPAREEGEISSAVTRWRVSRVEAERGAARPAWTLVLLREKSLLGFTGSTPEA